MINKGEIWDVNLPSSDGTAFEIIQAVVVSSDIFETMDTRVIIPVLKWKTSYGNAAWLVQIYPKAGLPYHAALDALQLMEVAITIFIQKRGILTPQELSNVEYALATVLDL